MNLILIAAAILLFSLQSLSLKKIQTPTLRENLLATGAITLLISIGFWVGNLIQGVSFSGVTVSMGTLYGVVFVATLACYYFAMQTGPLSYSAFFFSASMLVPSLGGILIWKEPLTVTMGISMLLFLVAFYFISVPGADKSRKISKKWMLFCFLSWLLNGSLSLIVKTQQMVLSGEEGTELMTAGFTAAALTCLVGYVFLLLAKRKGEASSKKGTLSLDKKLLKASALPIFLVAVGGGLGNAVVTYLASRMPSAYLFPFVLGGLMVAVTLYSALVLKEKINKFGIIGISMGIAAIVLINL